jgi:transcriptional regulator with XRE-family HTH domain
MTDSAVDQDEIDPAVARLATEIRRSRTAVGLSHAELAERIGYTRQYVSLAERPRKGMPSADLVRAIDEALDSKGSLIVLREKAATARQARRGGADGVLLSELTADTPLVKFRTRTSGGDDGPRTEIVTPPATFFTGSSIDARAFAARDDDRILATVPTGFAEDPFLRRPRRGLVVGVTEGARGVRMFALDNRHARRRLTGAPDRARLLIPRAYELDDLTLGILWAVANLDETLLDDDAALSASTDELRVYEQLARSAASREIALDLAPASRMWLGSQFCARHILRHADTLTDAPTFWTREQRGEEASTWLLFAHKYAYLRQLAPGEPGHRPALTRGLCVPPSTVVDSSRSERILLLLALALMESFNIAVNVTAESEYVPIPGFVFDGSRQAIVANWVGTEGVWQVDVSDSRSQAREFADVARYASVRAVNRADTPVGRLQALAGYLDLDWSWLVRRCGAIGDYGSAGIAQPRSRLLSTAGVDQACRFLAEADRAAR